MYYTLYNVNVQTRNVAVKYNYWKWMIITPVPNPTLAMKEQTNVTFESTIKISLIASILQQTPENEEDTHYSLNAGSCKHR